MSEEEKEAIKYLQHLRKYVAGTDEEEFVLLALNLIEKQNNRIEQLDKRNNELIEENKALKNECKTCILREELHEYSTFCENNLCTECKRNIEKMLEEQNEDRN